MSLASYGFRLALVAMLASACGGETNGSAGANEPQTAREKQLRDAKAAGELDAGDTKWGKWRYTGDRRDCFFVVGNRCVKTEAAACQAVRCKAPAKCKVVGGGPARAICK